jgi:hypothetical protein
MGEKSLNLVTVFGIELRWIKALFQLFNILTAKNVEDFF